MAAAITLQEQGVETLVVDKMASAGGATALTGALINGGCSKQQAERGVTDDVQTMFMDAMEYGMDAVDEGVRAYLEPALFYAMNVELRAARGKRFDHSPEIRRYMGIEKY